MTRQMWASVLAKLVAPMDAERAAKALASMLPMLAGYPDEAFTPDSAKAICATARILSDGSTAPLTRVPTFGELDAAFGAWWGKKRELAALMARPVARELLTPPPSAPGPCDRVKAEVRSVVASFVAGRSKALSRPGQPRVVISRPVSDGALLAEYDRLASQGNEHAAMRADHIRSRIARSAE